MPGVRKSLRTGILLAVAGMVALGLESVSFGHKHLEAGEHGFRHHHVFLGPHDHPDHHDGEAPDPHDHGAPGKPRKTGTVASASALLQPLPVHRPAAPAAASVPLAASPVHRPAVQTAARPTIPRAPPSSLAAPDLLN